MITELRTSKRYVDYLPIRVTARDGVSGEIMAGPLSGRIIDISTVGACLLMTQIMSNSYHIFHSTRENDSLSLQLQINLPPDIMDCNISARPIWMNLFRQDEIRAFKMGVEFLTNPEGKQIKELMTAMARQQKKRAAWWSSQTTSRVKNLGFSLFTGR
jgi:hypothetical protein